VQYFRATIKDIMYPVTLSIVNFYDVNILDFLIATISDIINSTIEEDISVRGKICNQIGNVAV
jgi:hypothetical protein